MEDNGGKIGTVVTSSMSEHKSAKYYEEKKSGANRSSQHRPLSPHAQLEYIVNKDKYLSNQFDSMQMEPHTHFLHMLPDIRFKDSKNSDDVIIRFDPLIKEDMIKGETPSGVLFQAHAVRLGGGMHVQNAAFKNKESLPYLGNEDEVGREKIQGLATQAVFDEYNSQEGKIAKTFKVNEKNFDGKTYLIPDQKHYPNVVYNHHNPKIEYQAGLEPKITIDGKSAYIEFYDEENLVGGIKLSGDMAVVDGKVNPKIDLKPVEYSSYSSVERGELEVNSSNLNDLILGEYVAKNIDKQSRREIKQSYENLETKIYIQDIIDYSEKMLDHSMKHSDNPKHAKFVEQYNEIIDLYQSALDNNLSKGEFVETVEALNGQWHKEKFQKVKQENSKKTGFTEQEKNLLKDIAKYIPKSGGYIDSNNNLELPVNTKNTDKSIV